jgi:aminopeptidase N
MRRQHRHWPARRHGEKRFMSKTTDRWVSAGLLAGATGLLACAPALAGAPFSFDSAYGRLPKSVVPMDYTVAITPDVAALTFTGEESVKLRFRSASPTVIFNSLNQELTEVRLDGQPVAKVASDDSQQLTTVTLARAAKPGTHTLSFHYRGKLETQPHGLFVQHYKTADGADGVMLSTKMESTDARRMFPCWDEPAFRATFALTVTVPSKWATVSNMPVARRAEHGALATTSFAPSPKMPSYLIEFSAGELAQITARVADTQLGVWAVRGREADGATALSDAQLILADYNDYFGYPYPLPKLDAIAVPGGFSGAMENWGAITYNDQLLLLNDKSTVLSRQIVFAVQAHEMAHQWNGDLVTMGWWDDLWLNESFASWRATKETDLRHPEWKWLELGADEAKEYAMRSDARAASHPIQQHVANELQAANAFDEITYQKGEAVLRMFEAYLGPEVFRDGIRRYMRAHAYSNASAQDLWNALSAASGADFGAIAAGWTEQMGFPLVKVVASCDAAGARQLALSQTRFLLQGEDASGLRWRVPLRIRAGANGTPVSVLLTADGQTAAAGQCAEPLSVNADLRGFYRVSYDEATLATNTRAFGTLPDLDRIALLDDQWALVLAERAQLGAYLALAAAMGSDADSRAWQQIATAFGTIEHCERGSPGHSAFAAYARSLLRPMAARLGWEAKPGETPDVQELRRTLLRDLGVLGDPEVIAEARRRYQLFLKDHAAVKPDDQELVLSIVAQYADSATFEQLHAIARDEKDSGAQERYYTALMNVADDALAQRAAAIALSGEIPPQSEQIRFRLIAALAEQHPALAWQTVTANIDKLLAPFPKYAPLITARLPEFFWEGAPAADIEGFVRAHLPAEMTANVARGMETARARLAQKQLLVREADAYLASGRHG